MFIILDLISYHLRVFLLPRVAGGSTAAWPAQTWRPIRRDIKGT